MDVGDQSPDIPSDYRVRRSTGSRPVGYRELRLQRTGQRWHADHVDKHSPDAIEALYLLVFLAFNIFHAFLMLNLRPECRRGKTELFWIRVFISEIYPKGAKINPIRSP